MVHDRYIQMANVRMIGRLCGMDSERHSVQMLRELFAAPEYYGFDNGPPENYIAEFRTL